MTTIYDIGTYSILAEHLDEFGEFEIDETSTLSFAYCVSCGGKLGSLVEGRAL